MMKRFEKRLLSLLLCAVLLMGVVPMGVLSAAADTPTSYSMTDGMTLQSSGLEDAVFNPEDVTASSFTLKHNGALLYGVPNENCKEAAPKKNVANLVIPLDAGNDRVLSFDYDPYLDAGDANNKLQTPGAFNSQYIAISVGTYTGGGSDPVQFNSTTINVIEYVAGHKEVLIPSNEKKYVRFEVYNRTGAGRLTVTSLALNQAGTAGTDYHIDVTAVGEGVGDVVKTFDAEQNCISLSAKPDANSVFVAYLDDNNPGYVLSSDPDYTIRSTASGISVKAVFGKKLTTAQQNFRIGCYGSGYCYTETLDQALAMVRLFSDKTIIVNNHYELNKSYTIPADVTLVVPENPADDGYCRLYTSDPHIVRSPKNSTNVYKRLVLGSGVKLEVKGTLYIGGSMYVNSTASHQMTGQYGLLHLKDGSEVSLTNGSRLYAWGYVTGAGVINASSGSETYEMLQICDWRAGMNTLTSIMGSAFPFEQFYVQNIESKIEFYPGAKETVLGLGDIFGMAVAVSLPFIGEPGESLFSVQDGTITKYVGLQWDETAPASDEAYKATSGDKKLHIDISGSAKVTSFPMMSIFAADYSMIADIIPALQGLQSFGALLSALALLNSDFLSIPISNMSIKLAKGGHLTTNQPLSILPGSDIIIEDGALFEMNASVIAYDSEAWCNSSEGDICFTGKYKNHVVKLQYSPSFTNDFKDDRTNASMADPSTTAHIDINGTVVLNDGIDYNLDGLVNLFSSMGDVFNTNNISAYCSENPDASTTVFSSDEFTELTDKMQEFSQWMNDNSEADDQAKMIQLFTMLYNTAVFQQLFGFRSFNQAGIGFFDYVISQTMNDGLSHFTFATTDGADTEQGDIYEDNNVYSDIISSCGKGTVVLNSPSASKTFKIAANVAADSVSIESMYGQSAWLKNQNGSYANDDYNESGEKRKYVNINGTWEPQTATNTEYTVTWLDDQGGLIDTTTVNAGETPAHAVPVKTDAANNYTFDGWSTVPTDWTLKGSFDSWGDGYAFVKSGGDVVTVTKQLQGSYQFQIVKDGIYYGNTGTIADTTVTQACPTGEWDMTIANNNNCTLNATGGYYTFIFDTNTKKLIVLHDAASAETSESPAPASVDITYQASYISSPKTYTVTLSGDGITSSSQTVEAGTTPDVSAIPDSIGTGTGARLFSFWSDGSNAYSKYELPEIHENATFTAVYVDNPYFDHDTLTLTAQISDNLYFDIPAELADDAAVYCSYSVPDSAGTSTTHYRKADLVPSDGLYKASILLPPAEMTCDLTVTLRVGDVSVDYAFEGADYAERLFAADSGPIDGSFYLVGIINGENCWPANCNDWVKYKMKQNTGTEYVIWNVKLKNGDAIKGYEYRDSNGQYYYPDQSDKIIDADGYYNIYVSTVPHYGDGWWYDCLYVQPVSSATFDSNNASFAKQVTSALMNCSDKAQTYFDRNKTDMANTHVNGNIYNDYTVPNTKLAISAKADDVENTMLPLKLKANETDTEYLETGLALKNAYNINYYGSTYILNAGVILRHYFRVYGGTDNAPATVTFTTAAGRSVTANKVVDNPYFVHYDYAPDNGLGIPGAELGDTVTVHIGSGDGEITGDYSFYHYAANIAKLDEELTALGITDPDNFKELICAMYWYNDEAAKYFALREAAANP